MKSKTLKILLIFLFTLFVQQVFSTTYYVAINGHDSNDGSESNPWATIQKAAETLVAGDTVIVKAGTYNTSLYFKNSGNAANGYITYMANPGDTVIIDGTGVPEYQFGDMDGLINSQGKSYIKFIGFHIDAYETHFGIYFRGPASHIEIRDCIVSNGNIIDKWGGHAFVIWGQTGDSGPVSNVIIDGNEVYNNYTGGNEQLTLYGEVSNFEVTNNIIYNCSNINLDFIGRISINGVAFGRPHNGLVKGNICYGAGRLVPENSYGSGIYTDGAGKPDLINSIIIEDNISYDNDFSGIEIGDEHDGESSGGILVKNNISYKNDFFGIFVGGGGIGNGGTVKNVNFYNNTTYKNLNEISISTVENINFKNNIFYRGNNDVFLWMEEVAVGKVNFNYNCWFPDGNWAWGNSEYIGFSVLQQNTSQFQNGLVADPLFRDVQNNDFHLKSNSPCIDAGTDVGLAYSGLAPDIGAFEFDGVLDVDSFDTTENNLKAFPNPFTDTIKVSFFLPLNGLVELNVYDLAGRKVRNLINELKSSGNHTVYWDGTNDKNQKVSSAMYTIALKYAHQTKTFKVIMLR